MYRRFGLPILGGLRVVSLLRPPLLPAFVVSNAKIFSMSVFGLAAGAELDWMLVIAARMVCNSVGGGEEAEGGGVFSFVWLIALAISVNAMS